MKLALSLLLLLASATQASAAAPLGARQYYETTWTYSTTQNYYYVNYYYRTTVTQTTYDYHYCIYYPSQPSYVYYYNPQTHAYWGRYKIGSKGDERYSILDEKDRKENFKDIPEEAFPKPAAMPAIPGSKDKVQMDTPPENVPKDKDKK